MGLRGANPLKSSYGRPPPEEPFWIPLVESTYPFDLDLILFGLKYYSSLESETHEHIRHRYTSALVVLEITPDQELYCWDKSKGITCYSEYWHLSSNDDMHPSATARKWENILYLPSSERLSQMHHQKNPEDIVVGWARRRRNKHDHSMVGSCLIEPHNLTSICYIEDTLAYSHDMLV